MNLKIQSTINDMTDSDLLASITDLHSSVEELNTLEASVDTAVSTEEFTALFTSMSSVYKATISKLSNLFHFAKAKYKTEFAIWNSKEHKVIASVEELTMADVPKVDVDYPTGMVLNYKQSTDLITEFFTNFESGAQLGLVSSTIDGILSSISKESNSHELAVKVATKTIATSSKNIIHAATVLKNGFVIDSRNLIVKKPFEKLFSSIDELKAVRLALASIDPNIGNINKVNDVVKNIEKSLDLCVHYLNDRVTGSSEGYVPSKEFLISFSNFIKQIDSIFTAYGDVTIRTMAIQHNLTFVYSKLYTSCK